MTSEQWVEFGRLLGFGVPFREAYWWTTDIRVVV